MFLFQLDKNSGFYGNFRKLFNILLLRNRKEGEAETWHTCIGHCPLQKLCFLFQVDENSGCYGNL